MQSWRFWGVARSTRISLDTGLRSHLPKSPTLRRRRYTSLGLVTLACGVSILSISLMTMTQSAPAQEILRQLHSFREMGSVLYIAAHPDDENTELIAYFARGRN